MSRHPEVKWAERLDKVYITIQLPDAKNVKLNLEPEGVFTFSATGTDGNLYEFKLELHDKVNVEDSKLNTGVRNIFCVVEKAEKGWWSKLLCGDTKTPHYVKVDWDKWVDEDDNNTNDGPGDMDLGGMDFSNFANMGGMGGMDEFDDTDDEEQAAEKPGETANTEDTGKAEEVSSEAKTETASST